MTDPIILADHAGVRLTHGKPKVNGVEIHYAIGGAGEPVFRCTACRKPWATGVTSSQC